MKIDSKKKKDVNLMVDLMIFKVFFKFRFNVGWNNYFVNSLGYSILVYILSILSV